jgi:hypothetical protein
MVSVVFSMELGRQFRRRRTSQTVAPSASAAQAHTIMKVGLASSDVSRINDRDQAAKAEGLWSGDYAMTSDMEFWAVMSQFYFNAGPGAPYAAFHHLANGPTTLSHYDHATFALLDSMYRGSTNLQ